MSARAAPGHVLLLGALLAAVCLLLTARPASAAGSGGGVANRDGDLAIEAIEGDLTWEFAPHGVFVDTRAVTAFVLLLDEAQVMGDASLSNTPLYYGDPEVRSLIDDVSPDDVLPLLAAAGIDVPAGVAQIEQARRCRIWTPPNGDSLADRQAVADALSDGLVGAFAAIGVVIEPCEPAASAAEADVAVSYVGLDSGLPASGSVTDDAFVSVLGADDPPNAGGGLVPDGDGPQPADTGPAPAQGGNAGLSAVHSSPADLQAIAATIALGLLLFGGRWLSSNDRGD